MLDQVARAVGLAADDLSDEHARWRVYERALDALPDRGLLKRAVAVESDKVLAEAVVLRMVEQVADDEQDRWIELLPSDRRSYSRQRAHEVRVLRHARSQQLTTEQLATDLVNWSDWLQRRVVSELADRAAVELMAERGRTKRVRNAARERVKRWT